MLFHATFAPPQTCGVPRTIGLAEEQSLRVAGNTLQHFASLAPLLKVSNAKAQAQAQARVLSAKRRPPPAMPAASKSCQCIVLPSPCVRSRQYTTRPPEHQASSSGGKDTVYRRVGSRGANNKTTDKTRREDTVLVGPEGVAVRHNKRSHGSRRPANVMMN